MSEQELDDLDHAVALALGGKLDGDGWRFSEPLTMYGHTCTFIKTKRSFCRDWEYGGPIIELEQIRLMVDDSGEWWAEIRLFKDGRRAYTTSFDKAVIERGPSPLVAAMRAYVAR